MQFALAASQLNFSGQVRFRAGPSGTWIRQIRFFPITLSDSRPIVALWHLVKVASCQCEARQWLQTRTSLMFCSAWIPDGHRSTTGFVAHAVARFSPQLTSPCLEDRGDLGRFGCIVQMRPVKARRRIGSALFGKRLANTQERCQPVITGGFFACKEQS
jgi:hypothetical protein